MVRTEGHRLRTVAGDSEQAAAVKVVARAHKSLIWERTRHSLRLRQALREFYTAALHAFPDLTAAEALELLAKAPDPASAARLTVTQIAAALQHARRRKVAAKAQKIQAVLRTAQLRQPDAVSAAYAAQVRAEVAILVTLNAQVEAMEEQVETHFGQHPDAEIYLSQPGLGYILGARVLAEFGDDSNRYRDARSRKNYAGTSPITRQSGKSKLVVARHVHNDRLLDALGRQAFAALSTSPGARAYYQQLRDRRVGHQAALRQLGNRLVGILHGCLKAHTCYDEATALVSPQSARINQRGLTSNGMGCLCRARGGGAGARLAAGGRGGGWPGRQAQLASSVTVWIVDGVGCCAPPAASTLTARPVTPLMASRKNSLRSPPPGTRLSGIAR
jgi:hypothetical protein